MAFKYEYVYLTEKDSQKDYLAKILGCKSEGEWKPAYSPDGKIAIVPLRGHLFQTCEPEEYDPKFKVRYHPDTIYFFPSEFKMKPKLETKHLLNTAINILRQAKHIILAVDLDNEGAKLGRDVLRAAGVEDRVLKMIDTSSLTETALKKALSDNKNNIPWKKMALAGQARAHIDFAEGVTLSRALTYYLTEPDHKGFYPNALVFGGVKAPLMKMVVDRDYEHENFKERPYWYAEVILEYEGKQFNAQIYRIEEELIDGKTKKTETVRFFNEKELLLLVDKLKKNSKIFIDEIISKKKKTSPPKLYDFTSLSADIAKKRKILPNQVLETAQALYMELKMQTYPRTEVRYLRDEDYDFMPNVFKALMGSGIVKDSLITEILSKPLLKRKSVFDSSKVESHTAIIPTDNPEIPALFRTFSENDAKKLVFESVVKRFVANFLPDAESEIYGGRAFVGEDYFISFKEEIPKVAGWKIVYDVDANNKIAAYQRNIPSLIKGDELKIIDIKVNKGYTSPPPRYNTSNIQTAMANIANLYKDDPTIREFLGEHGIGTTATRAKIIEDMIKQGYFELEEQGKTIYIKSTQKAREQIKIMPEELSSPLKRAILNKYISEIVKGNIDYDLLIRSYQKELKKQIEAIKEKAKDPNNIIKLSQTKEKESLGKCPLCKEGDIIEGKKAYICSNSKLIKTENGWENQGCKFSIWKNALEKFGKKNITPTEVKKLLKDGKTVVTLYSSKTNKPYKKEIEIDLNFGVKVNFDSNIKTNYSKKKK